MSTVPAPAPPPRHALGLPAGSIRAVLALGILAYLWILALSPSGEEGKRLIETDRAALPFVYLQVLMVLILAHFFVAHGKTIGHATSTGSPLHMPRGTVRFLLLGGYLGLAFFMYHQDLKFKLPETGPLLLLLVILLTAFLVGHAITALIVGVAHRTPAWLQDVQAWFALIGLLLLGIIVIVRLVINPSLPLEQQVNLDVMEAILAGVVGFYFGARS